MVCNPQFSSMYRFLLAFLVVSTVGSYSFNRTNSMLTSISKRELGGLLGSPESFETGADRYCDHEGYFNPKNWQESGAGEAYMEWTMLLDKSSTAWQQRVSEPNFFARDVLGWSDMDCGVTYRGCVRMPTCDYILAKTGDAKLARQIYFILLSMNNINLLSGVANEQSLAAQVNVASMTSNMANTFFWKHSDSLDAKCKQEASIIKGIISGFMSAFLIFTAVPGQEVIESEKIFKALKEAKEAEKLYATALLRNEQTVTYEMAQISRRRMEANSYAWEAARETARIRGLEAELRAAPVDRARLEVALTRARESFAHEDRGRVGSIRLIKEAELRVKKAKRTAVFYRIRAANKHWEAKHDPKFKKILLFEPAPWGPEFIRRKGFKYWTKLTTGKPSAIPFGLMGMPIAADGNNIDANWCARYANPALEDEHVHRMDLDNNIEKAGVKFREQVQSNMADINRGVGFEKDGEFSLLGESVLSDQIYEGKYVAFSPVDHLRFVEEPFRVERDITTHFKNAVISQIMKNQLCYLHCSPSASGFSNSSSRFEPVPGTMCQTQCWRNWRIGKTVEMYGIERLMKPDNMWDLNMWDFVSESFKHWQEYRYDQNAENLFPTIDELFTGKVTSTSGLHVPVCYSELMVPQNFRKKEGHEYGLPCICGDTIGNETMLFFQEAGFKNWITNENGKALALSCQASMSHQKAPPVQTFLSLCHLEWHFPLKHDHSNEPSAVDLQQGRDDMCDDMEIEQSELMQQGWDDWRINCHICFTSPIGRAVADSQVKSFKWDNGKKSFYSFRTACHVYDSNPQTSCLY